MSAEQQGLLGIEFCYPTDSAIASGSTTPTVQVAEQTKASARNLATMLEYFWLFYEAMRNGKPLPDADAKLQHLSDAMRMMVRRT